MLVNFMIRVLFPWIFDWISFLKTVAFTFPRDVRMLRCYLIIRCFLFKIKYKNMTTAEYFDSKVAQSSQKPCFISENGIWTFEKVQKVSYKIANYFQSIGFRKGDTVALLMENRPEYICIWIGLSRIGVVTSLLNYNIRLDSLDRYISESNCRAIIFGTELRNVIQDALDHGGVQAKKLFYMEDTGCVLEPLTVGSINLTKELEIRDDHPTVCEEKLGINDPILNLCTSGTTGFPKAVVMTHMKIFCYSAVYRSLGVSEKDVLLTPGMPLYHAQGGVVGVSSAIFHGVPQVILRKFSASNFWAECVKYNVTVCQYIGEIIRYVMSQPENSAEKVQNVRMFLGNGLSPIVWTEFAKRYPNICVKEMYGSTEGNCSIANTDGRIGACGHLPVLLYPMLPICIIQIDAITGKPIRDSKTGLVKMAAVGEPGEVLGRVNMHDTMLQFHGYTNKTANDAKLLKNVKRPGDLWFRSGDILLRDALGYLYFKDRIGDTFRWKGENVSTAEVEQIVTRAAGLKSSVVYGVQIPGTEGRCGMATISDPQGNLDMGKLTEEITRSLPSYARPRFLRIIQEELSTTGTFKVIKSELQKEGFRLTKHGRLYFLLENVYVKMNGVLYDRIISGAIKM